MNLFLSNLKVCFDSILVGLLIAWNANFIAYAQVNPPNPLPEQSPEQLLQNKLCQATKPITVKVFAKGNWGSGVIVQKQGTRYSLVTNGHVLEKDKETYTIQTNDGQKYQAKVLVRFDRAESTGNDLAILQFNTSVNYPVAQLARWSEGEKVLAVGYPVNPPPTRADPEGYMCSELGSVSLRLDQPMQEGYQLGYFLTDVRDGMSGGPVLNEQGQVVGIHGWGEPLFMINPDLYLYRSDNSRVSESLENLSASEALNLLSNSNWGIPIETFVSLSQNYLNLTIEDGKNSNSSVSLAVTNNPIDSASTNLLPIQLPRNDSEQLLSQTGANANSVQSQTINSQYQESSSDYLSLIEGSTTSYNPIAIRSELKDIAIGITVSVVNSSISPLGQKVSVFSSGVTLAKDSQTYYVLTIASAVHEANEYTVITPDQNHHTAIVIEKRPDLDLAILQFTSQQDYSISKIGDPTSLREDSIVYTLGWFHSEESANPILTDVKIVDSEALHLELSLVNSNKPVNGMLGGALLDQRGHLIGIYSGLQKEGGISRAIPVSLAWQMAPPAVRRALVDPGVSNYCSVTLFGDCSP